MKRHYDPARMLTLWGVLCLLAWGVLLYTIHWIWSQLQ